jgi:multidrug efflux system outer membrane protein
MILRPLLMASLAAMLAACAAAPQKLPAPELRDDAPLAGLPTRADAAWPDPQWWRHYADPQLDRLVAQAMAGSPDLAVARSRVDRAAQSVRAAAAQAGLRIDGNAQVARQRMSEHGLIPAEFLGFTWYTQGDLGVQLSYDFDWWGKKRAGIEAAVGQARAAEAQRSAAALGLQAAVADTYFGWLADQARLQLATQQVRVQQQLLHIVAARTRAGLEPGDSEHQAQAQLAAARQQQAALQGSADMRRAALAALLGVAPAELPELQPRALPRAAAGLPEHASLDLVARRPDITASRWQVQSALRKTDVARAQFFPDISITALAGLSSIDMGQLLDPGSRVFALTPALHLPIFEGGALRANYGLSRADLDGAIAQYNATVIDAARDVATQALTLQRLAAQRQQQQAQLDAVAALGRNADSRQRQGLTSAGPALQARSQLLQQRDAAVALDAQALSADVALNRALGGGYRADAPADGQASASPAPHKPTTDSP